MRMTLADYLAPRLADLRCASDIQGLDQATLQLYERIMIDYYQSNGAQAEEMARLSTILTYQIAGKSGTPLEDFDALVTSLSEYAIRLYREVKIYNAGVATTT